MVLTNEELQQLLADCEVAKANKDRDLYMKLRMKYNYHADAEKTKLKNIQRSENRRNYMTLKRADPNYVAPKRGRPPKLP